MGESPEEVARDVKTILDIDAIPTLLKVICTTTGMRFAAVARVTDQSWTTCAVRDEINFGLVAGDQLDVNTTLCVEVRQSRTPIVIDQASADPVYCTHRTPKMYNIESYISVPIITKSGAYFGNLCALDPLPAKASDPRIIAMFTEFANLIGSRLEEEAAQATDRKALVDERAAAELREQFIAILGHDLRNPLQAVLAGSTFLERRLSEPDLVVFATRIKSSAKRMAALIDDVLDFTRTRLGSGIDLQFEEVDAITINLMAVVHELQDGRPHSVITTNFNVSAKVRCDVGRIQQLVSNLLGNALTHGSNKTPVKFNAYSNDSALVLEIWNDGEPIPPDSLSKIFSPFWRHSTNRERQGLGLGLHICSAIVSAHHGTISVSSTPASGTLFTVRLPASQSRS